MAYRRKEFLRSIRTLFLFGRNLDTRCSKTTTICKYVYVCMYDTHVHSCRQTHVSFDLIDSLGFFKWSLLSSRTSRKPRGSFDRSCSFVGVQPRPVIGSRALRGVAMTKFPMGFLSWTIQFIGNVKMSVFDTFFCSFFVLFLIYLFVFFYRIFLSWNNLINYQIW